MIFERLRTQDVAISSFPTGIGDAFGRLRVSSPHTLYDGKQIHDTLPLFWDEAETSGSGTSSSFDADRASTTLSVSATTAGTRMRQTFMRFNYEPGKSLLIILTAVLQSASPTGITAGLGYGNDENGLFFVADEDVIKVVKRSNVTGTPVDTEVTQANWNGDKLDGTGESGITLDPTKAQIMWTDIEWLGVGTVRMGFVIDGQFIVCHTFNHANSIDSVYMSSPNLPLRYWITNDGTGGAASLEHICATVISESGADEDTGLLRATSTEGTHVDANAANTLYAILGIRLKTTYLGAVVKPTYFSMVNEGSQDFEWALYFNPTVAGTFTYSDESDSAIQSAKGATANTVTGGYLIASGFIKSGSQTGGAEGPIDSALRLGSSIAGTRDELVLCCRPLAANADIQASLQWREIL